MTCIVSNTKVRIICYKLYATLHGCNILFSDENDYKFLMFEDKLVTISDTGKELGEFEVTISPAKHNVTTIIMITLLSS